MVPARHYSIPPLSRISYEEVLGLIEDARYFVLHAPRQTGKTSTLLALADAVTEGSKSDCRLRRHARMYLQSSWSKNF